eukprot:6824312-Pyramimonas_sp.AAC.1
MLVQAAWHARLEGEEVALAQATLTTAQIFSADKHPPPDFVRRQDKQPRTTLSASHAMISHAPTPLASRTCPSLSGTTRTKGSSARTQRVR